MHTFWEGEKHWKYTERKSNAPFYRIPLLKTPFEVNHRHLWLQAIKWMDCFVVISVNTMCLIALLSLQSWCRTEMTDCGSVYSAVATYISRDAL